MSTVAEIAGAIEKLDVREQAKLLEILPQHLKVSPEDLAWTRLAESAFTFWDNPEDAIYDQLTISAFGATHHPAPGNVLSRSTADAHEHATPVREA